MIRMTHGCQQSLNRTRSQVLLCAMQIHAEGEAEHAAIGHDAVLSFVPAEHEDTLRRAMLDHDRDFSAFYNKMADLLQ